MPIFEFACAKCGNRFEKLVRKTSAVACPACGGEQLERQYSTFSAKASSGPEPCAPTPSGGCGMCGVPGSCSMN
jgi:putative FmdB family regulatory protein